MSEWLIDIIKDWVIDQAYATEAWVLAKLYLQKAEYPGYGMPVHVTGDLDPDVTCTYFRCGDYDGKPCYSQEDGSYFIWWGVSFWNIGTAIGGGPAQRLFSRNDPVIFGDYFPRAPSTGTATVHPGYKYLLTSFVDRGDPVNVDFDADDFLKDFAWHELDLSGIVPEGAKGISVALILSTPAVPKSAMFRRHGNSGDKNVGRLITQLANISISSDITIAVDTDRKIDYWFGSATWTSISFTVKGWWL